MEVDRRYYNKLCRTECIRNSRRVFRLPRRSIKDASVARFASLNLSLHEPNSGENPRKGAAAPFLVVLRGIVKGENRNSPLTMLSFDRQRRFLSHMRKKAGLKPLLRKHSVQRIWPAERRPLCRKPHRALGAYERGLNITPTEPPRHSFSFSLSAGGRSPTAAPPLPPPARRRRSPASGCTAA